MAPSWRKSVFCPFKQERDHLGRILDSVSFFRFILYSISVTDCIDGESEDWNWFDPT